MKLLDYIKGRRRGREAHRIELEAMRDPLLGDAIEGYDKVSGDHSEVLERLADRIADRAAAGTRIGSRKALMERRGRKVRNWSMTAAAAVLVALTTGTLYYLSRDAEEDVVAQEIPAKVPAEYDTPLSHRVAEPEPADTETEEVQEPQAARLKDKSTTPDANVAVLSDFINVVKDEAVVVEEEYDFADEIEVFERDFVIKNFRLDSTANPTGGPPDNHTDKKALATGNLATTIEPSQITLDSIVVVAYGTTRKTQIMGAIPHVTSGELPYPPSFALYLEEEREKRLAEGGPTGSATVEFRIGPNGRPRRIRFTESSSRAAKREVRRLLREGPEWEASEEPWLITVIL